MQAVELCIEVAKALFEEDDQTYYLAKTCNGSFFDECVECLELEKGKIYPYSIKFVAHYGGEGRGDDYWNVYEIVDNSTGETHLVKFAGFYSSWNGVEWYDDPYFVVPKERTIVEYVEKK